MGLQYTYDNFNAPGATNLTNGRAIKITTNTGRGGFEGFVDLNNGGFNQDVMVSASSGQYRLTPQSGVYRVKDVPPGAVDVTYAADGYLPSTLSGIMIQPDTTVTCPPVMLQQCPIPANVSASDTLSSEILLTWRVINHEEFVGYNVYRSRWENGGYVKLNTFPFPAPEYHDYAVPDSSTYWYYVTASYARLNWTGESFISSRDSGRIRPADIVDVTGRLPKEFFLAQNYPNPFNPTTAISYGLSEDAFVRLEIYNIMGQSVRTLTDEFQTAGYKIVIWDGADDNGTSVSSGLYFYHLKAGEYQKTRKMLIIR
jgi:hypothetical protein